MRVDVVVTGRPAHEETTVTKTILQDILVLSAGQNIEPDSQGRAINTPVVTLLVTPQQAETLILANEGRIQLVLRNSADRSVEKTAGRGLTELYGGEPPKPVASQAALRAKPVVQPPPPPPPRLTDDIVVIRGDKQTVERVRIKQPE
jgi:pilus assembly protein CpaB